MILSACGLDEFLAGVLHVDPFRNVSVQTGIDARPMIAETGADLATVLHDQEYTTVHAVAVEGKWKWILQPEDYRARSRGQRPQRTDPYRLRLESRQCRDVFAVLTKTFWLSVFLPATAAIGLIVGGAVNRRFFILALGVLGLLVSMGWLILGLYVEAVVR